MKKYWIILPLAVISAAAMSFATGQTQIVPNQPPPSLLTENWTGSDLPYKEIEQRIKKEYGRGEKLETIAEKYKAKALLRPADPVSQFAWIYAARGADVVNGSLPHDAPALLLALEHADPGNVHEFTKYRFCMSDEADVQLPQKQIETVGGRLLAYDHNDDWVRLSLINLLSVYKTGPEDSLPYALEWVGREPKNEKAHSALGLVYFNMWAGGHKKNPALAQKALVEYQSYMHLAPPNDGFRKFAAVYIAHLQQAISGRTG